MGAAYQDQAYAFATPPDAQLHLNSLMLRFSRLAAQAGVPRIRFATEPSKNSGRQGASAFLAASSRSWHRVPYPDR